MDQIIKLTMSEPVLPMPTNVRAKIKNSCRGAQINHVLLIMCTFIHSEVKTMHLINGSNHLDRKHIVSGLKSLQIQSIVV